MSLQERMVFQEPGTGLLFRVVLVEPVRTSLMPLQGKGWPEWRFTKDVAEGLRSGAYVEVEVADVVKTTKAAAEHSAKVYKIFAPYVGDKLKLLSEEGRGFLYQQMKASVPTMSRSTFYKSIRRWLEGGCIPQALAATWKSGSTGIDTSNLDAMSVTAAERAVQAQSEKLMSLGKPAWQRLDYTTAGMARKRRQLNDPTAFVVDRAALRLFTHHYSRVKVGASVASVYKDMKNEVFSTKSATGDLVVWPSWATPTLNQFRDWYYRLVKHSTRRRNRKGSHQYELDSRARTGQGVSASYGAAVVVSADATIWNVPLVGDRPGAPLIGPAVVFRIRCKNTGILLGLGVSLENASWNGMASAIANCNEDKVAFCAKYDIKIGPEDWEAKGIPGAIEADCGETDNTKPGRFVAYTSCELRNLPPARPDLKPGVESDFNTLQVHLNAKAPGALIKQYEDMKSEAWQLRAAMTKKQFIRMLILEELRRMHTPRPQMNLPEQMVIDGVDTSPASMFRWSVENGTSGLRRFDDDMVRLSLLNTSNASVTESGLRFRRLLYLAPELELAEAFDRARAHGRRTVTVAYDPRLVNHVYILQGDPERPAAYTQCTLNRARRDQQDLWSKTFREAAALSQKQAVNNSAKAEGKASQLANWLRMQDETVAESLIKTKELRELDERSASALLKGKAAAREIDKNLNSPAEAILPSTAHPIVTPNPQAPANVMPLKRSTTPRRGISFADSVAKQIAAPAPQMEATADD